MVLSAAERKAKQRANLKLKKAISRKLKASDKKRKVMVKTRRIAKELSEEELMKKIGDSEFLTPEEKYESINNFENLCDQIVLNHCKDCRCVSMNLAMANKNVCKKCHPYVGKKNDALINNLLPIWRDLEGNIHYYVPEELSSLSDAERMLIQRASPFVPLHHIKNGNFGVKGHCCCFPQDISDIVNVLPRLPSDTTMIKMIHTYKQEINGSFQQKTFSVNRMKVIQALQWLKIHNKWYYDIEIETKNLDWIEGDEDQLKVAEKEIDCNEETIDNDKGPSAAQVLDIRNQQEADDYNAFGVLESNSSLISSQKDKEIDDAILQATKNSTMKWPSIGATAMSEYDKKNGIFCMAFPWLFPGGIGDFHDRKNRKVTVGEWAKRLMMYEDGRFVKDKMFSFYVLNYITRRRNQDSGNFFVNKFFTGNNTITIDELQNRIKEGKDEFLRQICYFTKQIKGSNGYWISKRNELNTWIAHHIEMGNGAPNYFGTFSCAEYHWPDIMRLVEDKVFIETGERIKLDCAKSTITRIILEHSDIVQAYFQKRVQVWFRTVGKTVFGIDHYWIRYEFAPSRGQIHAHWLAICRDKKVLYALHRERDNQKRADLLAMWAKKKFDLSANIDLQCETKDTYDPVKCKFKDVKEKQVDLNALKERTQSHNCSGYCLRLSLSTVENQKK